MGLQYGSIQHALLEDIFADARPPASQPPSNTEGFKEIESYPVHQDPPPRVPATRSPAPRSTAFKLPKLQEHLIGVYSVWCYPEAFEWVRPVALLIPCVVPYSVEIQAIIIFLNSLK